MYLICAVMEPNEKSRKDVHRVLSQLVALNSPNSIVRATRVSHILSFIAYIEFVNTCFVIYQIFLRITVKPLFC